MDGVEGPSRRDERARAEAIDAEDSSRGTGAMSREPRKMVH